MSKVSPSVGTSNRTPFKHWILDQHIGQVVGVGWQDRPWPNFRDFPLLVVDLCAGDGVCVDGEHQSSPFILHKHCWHAMNPPANPKFRPFSVDLRLIEASAMTFDQLKKSIEGYEKRVECQIIHADARMVDYSAAHPSQPCFINADPNNVDQLPIPADLNARITPATTFTVTLGCNVAGLKRLEFEKRAVWFDYINILLRGIPHWHDAILVELVRDASQWAYFSRVPSKWSKKQCETILRKGKTFHSHGVEVCSIRDSRDRFEKMIHRLFLTKKEIANG